MRPAAWLFSALALLAACDRSAADQPIPDQWRAVAVDVRPVTFEDAHVGQLIFRGGLELSADDRAFGGFSGIEMLDDHRIITVSDRGAWFEFTLALGADDTLLGVSGARTAPLRDFEGRVYSHRADRDAEDITQLADGRFAVSFEQWQEVRIYDFNRDGPFGAAVRGPPFAGADDLPSNTGPEALATMADGALLIGAEGTGAGDTTLWIAPLDATEPVPAVAAYPLAHGYAITSADRLPDGDYVLLERFYAPVIGARARIVRLPASELAEPGRRVSTIELAALAAPMPVDNFEGVAATRSANGVTRLYIISDDNFSSRQRTLLLAFDLIENEAEAD